MLRSACRTLRRSQRDKTLVSEVSTPSRVSGVAVLEAQRCPVAADFAEAAFPLIEQKDLGHVAVLFVARSVDLTM
jgi:hypothetical protein